MTKASKTVAKVPGAKPDNSPSKDLAAPPRELPKLVFVDEKNVKVYIKSPEHTKALFGAVHLEFAKAMQDDCLDVSGRLDTQLKNGKKALAIVAELAPNDGVEAMLATQMAAIHIAIMQQSRFLANADTLQHFEIYERALNKLARTFAAQTEALRKHRTGGQQQMVVEHVHVHSGGQAIVGPVSKGGVS